MPVICIIPSANNQHSNFRTKPEYIYPKTFLLFPNLSLFSLECKRISSFILWHAQIIAANHTFWDTISQCQTKYVTFERKQRQSKIEKWKRLTVSSREMVNVYIFHELHNHKLKWRTQPSPYTYNLKTTTWRKSNPKITFTLQWICLLLDKDIYLCTLYRW